MTGALTLRIATPLAIAAAATGVVSLRAQDRSGGFGVMPGHADFLTVLEACVVSWLAASGPWRHCALRGGVLRVTGGDSVLIACREATVGDALEGLRARVEADRHAALEASRGAKLQRARLHARAIRSIVRGMEGGFNAEEVFE